LDKVQNDLQPRLHCLFFEVKTRMAMGVSLLDHP
jgi:hypothetical protein